MEGLLAEAEQAAPFECCGLLLGDGRKIASYRAADNAHPDPATHFEIDPAALIHALREERQGGTRVAGYYHSHPTGPGEPSTTDRRNSTGDGRIWAIVARGKVTFWRDDADGFTRLSYAPCDG